MSSSPLQVPAPRAALVAVLVALGVVGAAKGLRGKTLDFDVYDRASTRFLAAEPLYRESDGKLQYKYAPPAAAVLLPWTAWPPRVAATLWNVGSVALLAWVVLVALRRRWPEEPGFGSDAGWLAALAALLPALHLELTLGQVNLFLLFLLTACAILPGVAGGAALAVAAVFKPPAVVLAPLAVGSRPSRALVGFAAAGVVLWGAVAASYGVEGTLELVRRWRETLGPSTVDWAAARTSQGLTTLLVLVVSDGEKATSADLLAAQAGSLVLVLAALASLRPRAPHLFAALALSTALLSPLAWRQNFVAAIPAFALLAGDPRHARTGLALVALNLLVGVVVSDAFFPREEVKAILGATRAHAWIYVALLLAVSWAGRTRGREARRYPGPGAEPPRPR